MRSEKTKNLEILFNTSRKPLGLMLLVLLQLSCNGDFTAEKAAEKLKSADSQASTSESEPRIDPLRNYKNPNTSINTDGPGKRYDFAASWGGVATWIPDGIDTVMGIIIYGGGFGRDGRDVLTQSNYQSLAMRLGWILVGTNGLVWNTWDNGVGLINALNSFGVQSGHPEIINAPIFYTGFSGGAVIAFYFNGQFPEKTIGFISNQAYSDRTNGGSALATPAMMVTGENYTDSDKQGQYNMFTRHYSLGALWSFVIQEGIGHDRTFTVLENSLAFPFLETLIGLRYPEGKTPKDGPIKLRNVQASDGWGAEQSKPATILAKNCPPGTPPAGACLGWMPSKGVALMYRGFATYDKLATMKTTGTADKPLLEIDCTPLGSWATIEVYNGASLMGKISNTDGGLKTSLSLAALPAGSHYLNILVKDGSGSVQTTAMSIYYTKK